MKTKGQAKKLLKQLFKPEFDWKRNLRLTDYAGLPVRWGWRSVTPQAWLLLDWNGGSSYSVRLSLDGITTTTLYDQHGEWNWEAATEQEAHAKAIAMGNKAMLATYESTSFKKGAAC